MDNEAFNHSLRKFLKTVGVGSQQDIEKAVEQALRDGTLAGTETLPATMTLEVPALKLQVRFEGDLRLSEPSAAQ